MASRLKKLRTNMGYSQLTVQSMTGIDQSDLSKLERGLRRLNLYQLTELAILYETSLDYIVGITDEPKPYPRSKMYNNENN